jgi:hypothetical protein
MNSHGGRLFGQLHVMRQPSFHEWQCCCNVKRGACILVHLVHNEATAQRRCAILVLPNCLVPQARLALELVAGWKDWN